MKKNANANESRQTTAAGNPRPPSSREFDFYRHCKLGGIGHEETSSKGIQESDLPVSRTKDDSEAIQAGASRPDTPKTFRVRRPRRQSTFNRDEHKRFMEEEERRFEEENERARARKEQRELEEFKRHHYGQTPAEFAEECHQRYRKLREIAESLRGTEKEWNQLTNDEVQAVMMLRDESEARNLHGGEFFEAYIRKPAARSAAAVTDEVPAHRNNDRFTEPASSTESQQRQWGTPSLLRRAKRGGFVGFVPDFARATGSAEQAILLSQLCFWFDKNKAGKQRANFKRFKHVWEPKTHATWARETGLSESQVKRAIAGLVDRRLVEKRFAKVRGARTTLLRPLPDAIARACGYGNSNGEDSGRTETR